MSIPLLAGSGAGEALWLHQFWQWATDLMSREQSKRRNQKKIPLWVLNWKKGMANKKRRTCKPLIRKATPQIKNEHYYKGCRLDITGPACSPQAHADLFRKSYCHARNGVVCAERRWPECPTYGQNICPCFLRSRPAELRRLVLYAAFWDRGSPAMFPGKSITCQYGLLNDFAMIWLPLFS